MKWRVDRIVRIEEQNAPVPKSTAKMAMKKQANFQQQLRPGED